MLMLMLNANLCYFREEKERQAQKKQEEKERREKVLKEHREKKEKQESAAHAFKKPGVVPTKKTRKVKTALKEPRLENWLLMLVA